MPNSLVSKLAKFVASDLTDPIKIISDLTVFIKISSKFSKTYKSAIFYAYTTLRLPGDLMLTNILGLCSVKAFNEAGSVLGLQFVITRKLEGAIFDIAKLA